jgi:hypothetical protein
MRKPLALLAAVALAYPAATTAHRGTGGRGYVSTFSGIQPNVLGVSVNVLGGDDRLRVSNYSGKTLVIVGYEGEPYLRFGDGGVFVNTRSPATYLNRFRYPPALATGRADASAKPSWRRVARGVTFEWHDHRIHWAARQPPKAVAVDPDHMHLLRNWRVPGRADGKPVAITGFLGYVPPPGVRGGDGARSWLVPVGVAVGGIAAAVSVGVGARRARRRAP